MSVHAQSAGFCAAATTLTRISFGPGLGTAISWRATEPSRWMMTAFCFVEAILIVSTVFVCKWGVQNVAQVLYNTAYPPMNLSAGGDRLN